MNLTAKQMYNLFIHRKDVFSTQQNSGAYFPIKRPITIQDLKEHLSGKTTLGTYCLDKDNTVKWACVDIDGTQEQLAELHLEARIIYDTFKDFPRMLEFSGRKGYHIWIFFEGRVTADYAQRLIKARLNRIDMNRHEVFPKQTTLNETRKYGNLVKLPLALHKVSGNKSKILRIDGIKAFLKSGKWGNETGIEV